MHMHCLDVSQERADYDRIDQEADEWRAKQIAKDIAKRKVPFFLFLWNFVSLVRVILN